MSRILVIEDEAHIAEGLRFNLEAEGHSVKIAATGEAGLEVVRELEPFDLLVVDVMLPGKDGFTVTQELRQARNYVPVLILTARGRPEDVLKGFEAGADDYLAKPFNLDILMARIASLLRRTNWMNSAGTAVPLPIQPEDIFKFDDKVADFRQLELRNGAQVYHLTVMEMELLRYLIRNSGRPVSRKEILENVWNLKEDTDTRAMDNFIVRLRRYIEKEPSQPKHLLTVRGLGYQFVPQPD